jgi:hypothetical protein
LNPDACGKHNVVDQYAEAEAHGTPGHLRATAYRRWTYARVWLRHAITDHKSCDDFAALALKGVGSTSAELGR